MGGIFENVLANIDLEFIGKIVVPVITGIFAIVVALIARKSRPTAPEPTVVANRPPVPPPQQTTIPASRSEQINAPVRGAPIQLTHSEIAASIKRGTPYQQSLLEKDYVGATVHWRGILRSIDRYADGRASVVVDCADDGSHVSCHGSASDISELRLTEAGSLVEVFGVIDCISSAYTELSDCLIRPVAKEAPLT